MTYQSLEDAVLNGKSLKDSVEYVMRSKNPNELFSDQHGGYISLLHYMVMLNSEPGVSLLLDCGADPNLPSSDGATPLWVAIMKPDLKIIELLIGAGADIHEREPNNGDTLLHSALVGGFEDVAQYFLDCGLDPDTRNQLGVSPRQIKLFNNLRQSTSGAQKGDLGQWLNRLGDEPNENTMLNFLNLAESLLENMVDQGKMTRVKAKALEREIEKFKNIQAYPEQLQSIKIMMMREIIDRVKTTFTEDLTI